MLRCQRRLHLRRRADQDSALQADISSVPDQRIQHDPNVDDSRSLSEDSTARGIIQVMLLNGHLLCMMLSYT